MFACLKAVSFDEDKLFAWKSSTFSFKWLSRRVVHATCIRFNWVIVFLSRLIGWDWTKSLHRGVYIYICIYIYTHSMLLFLLLRLRDERSSTIYTTWFKNDPFVINLRVYQTNQFIDKIEFKWTCYNGHLPFHQMRHPPLPSLPWLVTWMWPMVHCPVGVTQPYFR